jgi:hypothetical protein
MRKYDMTDMPEYYAKTFNSYRDQIDSLKNQLGIVESQKNAMTEKYNRLCDDIEQEPSAISDSLNDAAAIGYAYTYACINADKGIDIRHIPLPEIYENWKKDTVRADLTKPHSVE